MRCHCRQSCFLLSVIWTRSGRGCWSVTSVLSGGMNLKKRLIAATLGIVLSFSMGLEAGAAALDSGFESGFTSELEASESAGDVQQDVQSEEPSAEETDPSSEDGDSSAENAPEEVSDGSASDSSAFDTEDSIEDGFISEEITGWTDEAGTDSVQNFDDAGQTADPSDEAKTQASDSVFEWNEWEKTADGQFRLHKKTKAQAVSVQSSEIAEEAVVGLDETAVTEEAENQDASSFEEQDQTDPVVDALSIADEYYTAADGIVKITTRTEKGKNHTGYYLFDANGYLVTGVQNVDGTANQTGVAGEYYFSTKDTAQAYAEYEGQGAAFTPWTTTIGQEMRDYWRWDSGSGTFGYYGKDGKRVSISQLDATAKSENTYTGYFKINGEYYCLDENGTPRTGEITLTVNGVSSKYYFQPAAQAGEIPGKMFRNGWKKFDSSRGERWCYYDSGELDSSKIGKLMEHGVLVTDLDGLKDSISGTTYLIDTKGYLVKSSMKKASDGKYYITDKNGKIYKNRIVTYKKKQYYVTETGAKAAWKNSWHRCPGAGNRIYYFGSKPGVIVKKTGWQKVTRSNGKFYGWFLFTNSGKHYANKLKNGYYFKADGRLAGGITVINGKSYFFKPSSATTRAGQMVKNQMFVYKKKTYYAGSDGVLRKNGWQYVDGEWYYFKDMKVVTNSFVKRNGKYGYVDATGKFSTGWVIVDNSQNLVRYINPDAKGYVTNTSKWIDGKLYYFDKNGYRINDLTDKYKGPYTVDVDRVNGVMTIYADSARTIPVKSIRVSVGNPGTETPTGTYKLTSYSRWQALMGPSWGQYGTHVDGAGEGGIFVHSIACNNANSYNLPVSAYYRLGSPASHGCIRTCVGDARWVYYNCNGSTIRIFDGTYKADEVFKGPLGRRPIEPLKGMKNGGYYDPTDPAA